MKPGAAGKHYILELYDCPPDALDNEKLIRRLVKEGARAAGTTLLLTTSHRFFPQGLTALGLLTESHLSIHTWPEAGYAAVDLFTCGDHCRPEKACEFLTQALQAGRQELKIILRGKGVQSENSEPFIRFARCKPERGV
jgi:S-adenosylmethionine decarboxylase